MEVIFTVAYTEALRRRYIGLGAQIKGKHEKQQPLNHIFNANTSTRFSHIDVKHSKMLN